MGWNLQTTDYLQKQKSKELRSASPRGAPTPRRGASRGHYFSFIHTHTQLQCTHTKNKKKFEIQEKII